MDASALKRERILSAAMSVFASRGYDKSSMEEIASRARIGKTTLYYYFESKEAMFLDDVQAAYNSFFAVIEEKLAIHTRFEDRFRAILKLPIRFIFESMPILMEAQNSIPPAYLEVLESLKAKGRDRMLDLLRDIMEAGRQEGLLDAKLSVEDTIFVVHDWMLMTEMNLSPGDKDRILKRLERDQDNLIDMILYGIIKRGQ
ncbi:MAG TPA: helix-turn-helix domain-containing protein [Candidatus Cloacimonadota bacterium]|mgnify:CR=1 FL=1|nr:helix-turn-helix domain-containing protein [Candidatus Cloacimonadota bacterium]